MDFRDKRIFFNIVGAVVSVMLTLSFLFCIVLFTFCFTHIKTDVKQFSMYPTINKNVTSSTVFGDTVLVNTCAELNRGDIVVAKLFKDETPVVKRLVAMPNDSIRISPSERGGYELFVNENLIKSVPSIINYPDEHGGFVDGESSIKYYQFLALVEGLKENTETENRVKQNTAGQDMLILKDNEYLLLGDNWANSKDSIATGVMATKNNIYGNVDLIIQKGSNKFKTIVLKMFNLLFS